MLPYNNEEAKDLCDEIKKWFYNSIRDFLEKDENMKKDCSERAKVHRVAHYLENYIKKDELLKDYVIDCEYNRDYDDIKRLPEDFPYYDNKNHDGTFMADLIVHKRNTDCNLLYCEFKNKKDSLRDENKVKLLTNGKYKVQYLISASIIFNDLTIENYKDIDKIKWYYSKLYF